MTNSLRAGSMPRVRGPATPSAAAQSRFPEKSPPRPASRSRPDATITLDDAAQAYVSRAALKLIHALDHFGLSPQGCDCLDIGASTGGFTQVLLERGAAHVTAIDVGHDQMAQSLRDDPRVTLIEGLNARDLTQSASAPMRPVSSSPM